MDLGHTMEAQFTHEPEEFIQRFMNIATDNDERRETSQKWMKSTHSTHQEVQRQRQPRPVSEQGRESASLPEQEARAEAEPEPDPEPEEEHEAVAELDEDFDPDFLNVATDDTPSAVSSSSSSSSSSFSAGSSSPSSPTLSSDCSTSSLSATLSNVLDLESLAARRDAFVFVRIGKIMFRSQLDCWAPELKHRKELLQVLGHLSSSSSSSATSPSIASSASSSSIPTLPGWPGWENGGLVFDLKTRASLPIRLFCHRYSDLLDYHLLHDRGLLYSFEREYYDLQRSAFLKYMLQARLGRMGGVLIGYHNTARLFGMHYVSIKEMDEALFGHTLWGEWCFNHAIGIMQRHLMPDTTVQTVLDAQVKRPQLIDFSEKACAAASDASESIVSILEGVHQRNWYRQSAHKKRRRAERKAEAALMKAEAERDTIANDADDKGSEQIHDEDEVDDEEALEMEMAMEEDAEEDAGVEEHEMEDEMLNGTDIEHDKLEDEKSEDPNAEKDGDVVEGGVDGAPMNVESSDSAATDSRPRCYSHPIPSPEHLIGCSLPPALRHIKLVVCSRESSPDRVVIYAEIIRASIYAIPINGRLLATEPWYAQRLVELMPNYRIRAALRRMGLDSKGTRTQIIQRLEAACSPAPNEEAPSVNYFFGNAKANAIHKFVIQIKMKRKRADADIVEKNEQDEIAFNNDDNNETVREEDDGDGVTIPPNQINQVMESCSTQWTRLDREAEIQRRRQLQQQNGNNDMDEDDELDETYGNDGSNERSAGARGPPLSAASLALDPSTQFDIETSLTHFSVENGRITIPRLAREYHAAIFESKMAQDETRDMDLIQALKMSMDSLRASRMRLDARRERREQAEVEKRKQLKKMRQQHKEQETHEKDEEVDDEVSTSEAERVLDEFHQEIASNPTPTTPLAPPPSSSSSSSSPSSSSPSSSSSSSVSSSSASTVASGRAPSKIRSPPSALKLIRDAVEKAMTNATLPTPPPNNTTPGPHTNQAASKKRRASKSRSSPR